MRFNLLAIWWKRFVSLNAQNLSEPVIVNMQGTFSLITFPKMQYAVAFPELSLWSLSHFPCNKHQIFKIFSMIISQQLYLQNFREIAWILIAPQT